MSDYRKVNGFKVQPRELAPGARHHRIGCVCATCAALRLKVMTTEDWLRLHGPHTSPVTPIVEEPYPHPSGQWVRLVCPCKARQVTIRNDAGILL